MLVGAIVCAPGCVGMRTHESAIDNAQPVSREIHELHQFFQEWFNGSLADSDEGFARFSDVLAPGFTIVAPDGVERGRDVILDTVRAGRGSDVGARIWIEHVQIRHTLRETIVATYEEWRRSAGQTPKGRLSTVVFGRDESAPNGLVWLHVHETWLPATK